jgi:hypothetical protein
MKVYFYQQHCQGTAGSQCMDEWRIDAYESEEGCDDICCYEFTTIDELDEELTHLDKQIGWATAGTDLWLIRIRDTLREKRDWL